MASGSIFSDINPATTSGTQLATILNDFKDAVRAGFCTNGGSRPTNLGTGGYWIDQQNDPIWSYKMFDGTTDREIFQLNTTTGAVTISSSGEQSTITKISDDALGPVLKFLKARTTGDQTQDGDSIGDIEFTATNDAAGEELSMRVRVVATDNATVGAHGSDMTIEGTPDGGATMSEIIRVKGDGKVGLGTSTPGERLHVNGASSNTNAKIQNTEDSTTAPKVALKKSRIAGSGQTQTSDELGNVDFLGTDQNGAEVVVARVKSVAAENSTDTQHGGTYEIQTVANGATALVARLSIDNAGKVTISGDLQVDGTTTTVNSTTLDVTDSNVTLNKGGNAASGVDAGITVEMSDATDVVIEHNTALASKWQAGEQGSEAEVTTVSHTQTLTNKTINGGVYDLLEMVQQTTPANPAAGRFKLYFKSDGNLYKLDSAGTEAQVGGGGGSALEIKDEGVTVDAAVTEINVTGGGATAVQSSPGVVQINIPGGGGSINLAEHFNLYSAVVTNNGTAAITTQSQTFVQSVNRTALGVVDVVFTPGFFSQIPTVHATINEQDSNGDEGCFISAITTSGFTLNTTADSAAFDQDFSFECMRQGTDYDTSASNTNFYGAVIDNNGATASVTSQSQSFIQSVTRTATGTVDVVFNTSFFGQVPAVYGSINNLALQGDEGVFFQSVTAAGLTYRTTADSIAHDVPITIHVARQGADLQGNLTNEESCFAAKIQNNGTSTITSQGRTFIQSVSRTGLGVTDVTFTPGFFTAIPSLTGAIEQTATNGDEGLFIYNITTSGCTCETTADSAQFDQDFTLSAIRQASDYIIPSGGGTTVVNVVEDYYRQSGFVSKNGSNQCLLKTVEDNNSPTLFTYTEPGGDHSRFTFVEAASFHCSFSTTGADNSQFIEWYNSSDSLISSSSDSVNSTGDKTCKALVGQADVGDYLVAVSLVSPADSATDVNFSLKALDTALDSNVESIGYNGFTSRNGGGDVLFKTLVQDSGSLKVSDSATDHTRYEFTQICDFEVMASTQVVTSTTVALIWKNSSDVEIARAQDGQPNGCTQLAGRAAVGDYIIVNMSANPDDNLRTSFHVNAYPVSDTARTTHLMMFSDNDGYNSSRYLLQNQIVDTAGGLVTKSETGSYTRFTFDSACRFSTGTSYEGSNQAVGQFAGPELYTSGDVLKWRGVDRGANGVSAGNMVGFADAGDYLVYHSDTGDSSNSTSTNFWVYASNPGTKTVSDGNGFLGVISSDPVSPTNGESWINSTDKKHKFRFGGTTFSSAAYT
jgi:hypothetical protein